MTSVAPLALLWDVDGTIAETEMDGHRPAFNRAFAEAGLPWHWDRPTYRRLLSVSGGRERLAAYLRQVDDTEPDAARLDALQASKQRHYRALVEQGGLRPRPGVERLMAEAHAAGIPQAVVTTSARTAVQALARHGVPALERLVPLWICGDDVTAKKPDPEAYRLALTRLGLSGGGGVVAIEDSPQGLRAAEAAGIACLITLSEPSRQEPPEHFQAARAVCDGLGEADQPMAVQRGPACPEGMATLTWLEHLLG